MNLRFTFMALGVLALGLSLGAQDAPPPAPEQPASQPASQPTSRAFPQTPAQAEIFNELLRDTGRARPIPSADFSRPSGTKAGDAGPPTLLEGTVLVERSGRLIRGDESKFEFHPSDLGDGIANTMVILRNRVLELMESEADAGIEEFVISAEVTSYRGQNFLLLRKYQRRISHGNLGP